MRCGARPAEWPIAPTADDGGAWRADHGATLPRGRRHALALAGARLSKDRRLRACLATRGHAVLAPLYYAGVRIGGSPSLPTPWRWGFGWPFGRGYTAEENE